jgi:asparagine synthase (glutamine-hydrolysing)
MKGGLNYLGMAFIVPFLAEIRETLGAGVAYWTGDGGNRLQMDHRPTGNVNTLEALANYIIRNHQVLPLSTVAALTGVDEREMQQAVEELLASFPEKEVDQKYMRFHILEKMGRWNFEGEDRNRIYFWSVAPFLSVQFFRYLMNCPEEQKKRHALYKAFFKKLSTDAMQIDNANWGFSLNSKKYLFMMLLRTCVLDRISAALKTKIKAKLRGSDTDQYRSILHLQLGGCDLIKDHIAPEALASAIKNCSQKELATLVTITSVIEELECGRSSFEQFYNTNLFVVGNNDSSPPSRASLLVD